MSTRWYLSIGLLFFAACVLTVNAASAAPRDIYVPDQLKAWVPWVAERNPDLPCAIVENGRACDWPGKLDLVLGEKGGSFTYLASLDRQTDLPLPGGGKNWPQNVTGSSKVSNMAFPITEKDNRPFVKLPAGDYTISGSFQWDTLPDMLLVPMASGLIKLRVFGDEINGFRVSPQGELWLKKTVSADTAEANSLRITAQRKLIDGIPFHLLTRLELRIAGTAREIRLGNVLTRDAAPVKIESPLSFRLESENSLTIQARPGVYTLLVDAVYDSPPVELSGSASSLEGWPKDEIWVWVADEKLRSVEISGAPSIDPERTSLPPDWRGLPTYVVGRESHLSFKQTRRGEQGLPPNTINISRKVWLDLDGRGYTIQDQLSGIINQGWRLNMAKGTQLGHVSVDGQDQVITQDKNSGLSGVELRQQSLSLTAEARVEQKTCSLDAVGWDHDANSLSLALFLPPGWKLLEAKGVDMLHGSWISSWTLLRVFLVLAIFAATVALFGKAWGLLSVLVLVLCHDEMGAPFQIWFHLLACTALLRVLPPGTAKKFVTFYYSIALIFLAIIVLPFTFAQIQTGLFPQLGTFQHIEKFMVIPELLGLLSGPLAGIIFSAAAIAVIYWLIQLAIKRQWASFVKTLVLSGLAYVALLILYFASTSLFFGSASLRQYEKTMPQAPMPESITYDDAQLSEPAMMERRKAMKQEASPLLNYGRGAGQGITASMEADNLIAARQLQQVDPKAVVQTGPGVPSWNWRTWRLSWNGPVQRGSMIKLYLLGPWTNLVLSLVRVALLLLFAFVFVKGMRRSLRLNEAAALFALWLVMSPAASRADTLPNTELLRELETRVLNARCTTNCTSAGLLRLEIQADSATMTALLSSDGAGAWSVPGPLDQFWPEEILLDGNESNAVRRDPRGLLWIRVADGTHEVKIKGKLMQKTTVTLQFGLIPRHVEILAPGWEIDGLSAQGSVSTSLQLIRKGGETGDGAEQKEAEVILPHWYVVRRELEIGIPWTVRTTVQRLGNPERAHLAKIPILSGESVTTPEVKVENGLALVNFPRSSTSVSWNGVLAEKPTIALSAGKGGRITEEWELQCTSIFRCTWQGTEPTESIVDAQHVVKWNPWPSEEVRISVAKPQGVEGVTATVDSASLLYSPGIRLIESVLNLKVRSSQGGWKKITLPKEAEVLEVLVNGQEQRIRPKGADLSLPLSPGEQNFQVKLRQAYESSLVSRMPEIRLEHGAVNVATSLKIPSKRWALWARGPKWGPVFRYWGQLIIILIIALILAKSKLTPLGTWQWVLLGLGLSNVSPVSMLIPPLWLIALKHRGEHPNENRTVFNLIQVCLALLTLIALTSLYAAISRGLVGSPEMAIEGYGSNNWTLNWYTDRVVEALPAITLISVPLWFWRGLMFAWALWLAYALFSRNGWLRWGWESFSKDGLWRAKSQVITTVDKSS